MRKLVFYGVIRGISALSALFIAAITLGGALREVFGLGDPLTSWLGSVDLGEAGLLLVALLMSAWAVASLHGRTSSRAGYGR